MAALKEKANYHVWQSFKSCLKQKIIDFVLERLKYTNTLI